jgi:hypothetical protein
MVCPLNVGGNLLAVSQASHSSDVPPALPMVSGYSRWLSALLIASRAAQDLFDGWWRLIAGLGGVPRLFVWDGEGAIGRYRREASLLTAECQAFRGTLATKVYVCKPDNRKRTATRNGSSAPSERN